MDNPYAMLTCIFRTALTNVVPFQEGKVKADNAVNIVFFCAVKVISHVTHRRGHMHAMTERFPHSDRTGPSGLAWGQPIT